MTGIEGALLAAALLGHLSFCVGAINRLHASALARWQIAALEKVVFLFTLAVPTGMLLTIDRGESSASWPVTLGARLPLVGGYFWLCVGAAIFVSGRWCVCRFAATPSVLLHETGTVARVDQHLGYRPCGDWVTRSLTNLPGNQVFQLHVNRKELRLPRLPLALDGLTIAHLSDLHFTGHLQRAFFDFAVEQTNVMQPDLIAITGDVIDKPQCLPWIGDCLGRLQSRHGVFAVLGNHDLRVGTDPAPILEQFRAAGIVYLGGGWRRISIGDAAVLLAGNELPWWRPAADPATFPLGDADTPRALRILLSHSPDQIDWARRHDFDLMLAGHTHGGQIRLPMIGPILAHSHHGVKYASGVFHEPPVVMHVSRGLSGVENVRYFCRPELTLLVLRHADAEFTSDSRETCRDLSATLPRNDRSR